MSFVVAKASSLAATAGATGFRRSPPPSLAMSIRRVMLQQQQQQQQQLEHRSLAGARPMFSVATGSTDANDAGTLTKSDLAKIVSEEHDLSVSASRRIVDNIFDTVAGDLSTGKRVSLAKFGTFETYTSKAYEAAVPNQPGRKVHVPPKQRVRFKASKALKEKVQN